LSVSMRVPLLEVEEVLKALLGRLLLADAFEDVLERFLIALREPEQQDIELLLNLPRF
jgi:hypothetical protein